MNCEKIAKALIYHIERVDCMRYPVKAHPSDLLKRPFYGLAIFLNDPIAKYDPKLKTKIDNFFHIYKEKLYNGYYKAIEKKQKFKETLVIILAVIFLFVLIFFLNIHFPYLGVAIVFPPLFLISFFIAKFLHYEFEKAGNHVAPLIDSEIKEMTQNLINYLKQFFKENNINPSNYPLHLRHNDYEGLRYEKKGKNKYIAYVVVE